MGVAKPMGEYATQMLAPDAWPEVDEDNYYDRAQRYTEVLRQVTAVLEACQHEQSEIFDGGFWSGGAATAAKSELGTNIDELKKLQNGLATVITWHRYVAESIAWAKWDVSDIVEAAQTQIRALETDSTLDAAERTAAINTVVSTAYGTNLSVVTGAAERIVASKGWQPPHNALQDLLDQKTPPPVTLPDAPVRTPPVEEDRPRPNPAQPAPGGAPPAAPPLSPPGMPTGGGAQPPPGMPSQPGQPPVPPAAAPGGSGPAVPGGPGGVPGGSLGPPTPLSPAASAEPLGSGGRGKGMTPASLTSPSVAPRTEDSAAAAPAGAAGMPAGPAGAAGGGSRGGGAAAGAGAGSSAPAGPKSAGGTATTRPAAAGNRATTRPSASAADPTSSAERIDSADSVVVTPIIPVSKARAERDAIAEAATADAARRQSGGTDPLRLARRVAAALNAPGSPGAGDLGFFWVTAVTTDGAIVVANSYGLAYIPDGIQLPEQVQMASADESIAAAERAGWATYPVMAVQGWADHHDKKLRAVIATEEQLANSDSGAAKIVLKPDDIPDSGDMIGRSRLEVVDPEAADRLAATTDVRLVSMLPPAPADATPSADQQRAPDELVDPETAARLAASLAEGKISLQEMLAEMPVPPQDDSPSADERPMLWFELMKPLASRAPGRRVAHLRAFHRYAEHAQEVILNQAHTAVDAAAQRAAIADWLYWKHLAGLLAAALSTES
ncbi:hypothetical protein ACKUU1_03950 [Mycobacterium seoulense]|uniref:hypothetical protein n=1 Tax=Mycobacterium seoulense TaxID=386911 RepID=UPI003CF40C72